MVPYIGNLHLFEDFPRALEDEDYDAEDLFASCKRYSVPHIDDIIFRMSYDADFYAMLDPQSALSLEDAGGCDFVVEPDTKVSTYDYPREAAEVVDSDDWYPPHPELDVVLARVAGLQLEASHIATDNDGGLGFSHLTIPDVPFDATALQTVEVAYPYPDQDQESEMALERPENDNASARHDFDTGLSFLFPKPPQYWPLNDNEEALIHARVLDVPKYSSSWGRREE
jgi:hypothetical protein